MVKHKIEIKHYYQDPHNPDIQKVFIDADYAITYALFKALLESGLEFDVDIAKGDEKCQQ